MKFHNIIKEVTKYSDHFIPSKTVLNWLSANWALYISTVDNNSCTFRRNPFPCFCCIRKDDCLFKDIYLELSVIEDYSRLDKKCKLLIGEYHKIKKDSQAVEFWLRNNLELGLNKLYSFENSEETKFLKRSFINGKNKRTDEFDYIIIRVSLEKFNHNYEYKKLFNELFFEAKILLTELKLYKENQRLAELELNIKTTTNNV